MEYFEEPDFDPGGLPDRYDSRDYNYTDLIAGAAFPDWNKGYDVEEEIQIAIKDPKFRIPVKDQGKSYSCGGQAWAYYAEVLEALATGSFEERSAKYLYAQTCVPSGGSAGRDNAKVYTDQGIARESYLTSYENKKPPSEQFMQRSIDITNDIRDNAKTAYASSYAQIGGTDIDIFALAIENNHGAVLGINGSNNGTWRSEFPKAPATTVWRHWIFAGKYKMIDGKKYVGVLNSWSAKAGKDGWQWLGEEYFKSNNVFSGWTHVFKIAEKPVKPVIKAFTTDLSYGETSNEIRRLQLFLSQLGYFTVDATGYYGDLTRDAVYTFQKDHVNLSPWEFFWQRGSKVGPKTRLALNLLIK